MLRCVDFTIVYRRYFEDHCRSDWSWYTRYSLSFRTSSFASHRHVPCNSICFYQTADSFVIICTMFPQQGGSKDVKKSHLSGVLSYYHLSLSTIRAQSLAHLKALSYSGVNRYFLTNACGSIWNRSVAASRRYNSVFDIQW